MLRLILHLSFLSITPAATKILSTGSTLFVQVHIAEWSRITASPPRGALLTLQSVRKVQNSQAVGNGVDEDSSATSVLIAVSYGAYSSASYISLLSVS
jgi:hypothetical protein